ncbi:MAG: TM2 domain-containing protein [Prolixibacteraceae bacterium]|jgi:TM2 domain-containing membrane protein YozV|nr:TM2 domain-containing protein [Prolixibacteraceae bacterium]
MKKLILVIVLFVAILSVKQANASSYSVNEQAVDQLFENAIETSMISLNATELSSGASSVSSAVMASKEKNAVVAIALDFFLGGLGIHRFYLGTETLTGLGYILTCGGIFGIVPLIDFIVLIIDNEDISAYVNNPKFFMWN